jgi:hypothetical protein
MKIVRHVVAAVDTGMDYWYFTRHGLGPGTIPKDVTVLDTVEDGYDTWVLLDKMLTTAELHEFDLKEQCPPEGSVSNNGVKIECSLSLSGEDEYNGFDFIENEEAVISAIAETLGVEEDIASIIYTWYDNESAWEDFSELGDFLDYLQSDIFDMADACDDEYERQRVMESLGR